MTVMEAFEEFIVFMGEEYRYKRWNQLMAVVLGAVISVGLSHSPVVVLGPWAAVAVTPLVVLLGMFLARFGEDIADALLARV